VLASQWRHLAEEADETDKKPLSEKIRHAHFLREIDKAEHAIGELVALEGITAQEHRKLVELHNQQVAVRDTMLGAVTFRSTVSSLASRAT
jgi:thiamine monophosphate synthase